MSKKESKCLISFEVRHMNLGHRISEVSVLESYFFGSLSMSKHVS